MPACGLDAAARHSYTHSVTEHPEPRSSLGEEIASSVTHGLGLLAASAGLAVLAVAAAHRGDGWQIAGVITFGVAMVLLYGASTLYHSIAAPRAKAVLRRLDHSAIYLLIAGTYTPFALVSLRGPWGWTLLGIVWGCAIAGVVLSSAGGARWPVGRVVLYLVMGWLVLVAIGPLVRAVPAGGLLLLVLGGVAYTGGIAFYGWRRLPYNHAIWHLFVLAGTALHFFAVLLYVIPPDALPPHVAG